jgi:hypothetical protein
MKPHNQALADNALLHNLDTALATLQGTFKYSTLSRAWRVEFKDGSVFYTEGPVQNVLFRRATKPAARRAA